MTRKQQLINEIVSLVLEKLDESSDMTYDEYLQSEVSSWIEYNEDTDEYFVQEGCPAHLREEAEMWSTALTNLQIEHGENGVDAWQADRISLRDFL